MKKKKKKNKYHKKSFSELLRDQLLNLCEGEIESGILSDNSGCWVQIKLNHQILNFSFDPTAKNLTGIGLYEEVLEVTDQKKIFRLSDG